MRRWAAPMLVIVVMLVAAFGGSSRSWGAQEGTPGASPVVTGEDVTSVILGIEAPTFTEEPLTLALTRTTFPAGSSFQVLDFGDPDNVNGVYMGAFLSFVERGSLVLTLEQGTARYVAADTGDGTPVLGAGTAASEPNREGVEIEPNEEVVLAAGDSVFFENARFTMRNDGGEEAVLLNSVLVEEESACPPCPRYPGA